MQQLITLAPNAQTIHEMQQKSDGSIRWLWEGYIASGSITLLTSRWKSGKTTLLAALLSRMHQGGTLAGAAVIAAPATVVSEESHDVWVARNRITPFGPNVKWICRPFINKPTYQQWQALMLRYADVTRMRNALFVVDPLATHLPGSNENNAKSITHALEPLQQLTARGAAVLLLHHPRKGPALVPRGSGALQGYVDILMELDNNYMGMTESRRRWLRAKGRHAGIPDERLIELTEAGNDYRICDPTAEECADGWSVIRWILSDAKSKYTRDDIMDEWPEHRVKPHAVTLWNWLQQAHANNRLRRDGLGRKNRPFRYWLAEQEKHFSRELEPMEELGPLK